MTGRCPLTSRLSQRRTSQRKADAGATPLPCGQGRPPAGRHLRESPPLRCVVGAVDTFLSLSMASFRSWDPGSRLKSMLEVCSVCDSKTVPWTFCENEKNIFSDFSISTLASLDISTFSSFFKYPFWGAAVLSGSGKGRNSHPGYQWRNIYLRGAAPLRGGLATCSWVMKPQRGSTCSGAHSAEGRHLAGAGLAQGGPRLGRSVSAGSLRVSPAGRVSGLFGDCRVSRGFATQGGGHTRFLSVRFYLDYRTGEEQNVTLWRQSVVTAASGEKQNSRQASPETVQNEGMVEFRCYRLVLPFKMFHKTSL